MSFSFFISLVLLLILINLSILSFNKDGFNAFGKFIIAFAALIIILLFVLVLLTYALGFGFLYDIMMSMNE